MEVDNIIPNFALHCGAWVSLKFELTLEIQPVDTRLRNVINTVSISQKYCYYKSYHSIKGFTIPKPSLALYIWLRVMQLYLVKIEVSCLLN